MPLVSFFVPVVSPSKSVQNALIKNCSVVGSLGLLGKVKSSTLLFAQDKVIGKWYSNELLQQLGSNVQSKQMN